MAEIIHDFFQGHGGSTERPGGVVDDQVGEWLGRIASVDGIQGALADVVEQEMAVGITMEPFTSLGIEEFVFFEPLFHATDLRPGGPEDGFPLMFLGLSDKLPGIFPRRTDVLPALVAVELGQGVVQIDQDIRGLLQWDNAGACSLQVFLLRFPCGDADSPNSPKASG